MSTSEYTEPDENRLQPHKVQQQLLDDETHALQVSRLFAV
uniref:Uncharacterized protein MANES_10G019100 n=1 Tax=Rhizophora mucronata TaxID=61149 RepID=A0A2P2KRT7_RHIMU